MRNFLITAVLLVTCLSLQAQSHRLRFKYRISQKKITSLANGSPSIRIKDSSGNPYNLCSTKPESYRLKAVINQDKYLLNIDPWAIDDSDCAGTAGIINKTTDNDLSISLPARPYVGDRTIWIRLPYQSFIVGINSTVVKYRPAVKDTTGSRVSGIFSAGASLGFSLGYSFGWTKFTHRAANSTSVTPSLALGFSSQSLKDQPLRKKFEGPIVGKLITSPSLNVTIARNDIGLILSYGMDFMSGSEGKSWAYQGKGYFGLGVAAGLKL